MSDERPNGMRSNAENILRAALGEAVEYDNPNSPVEYYLVKLKEAIEGGGSSSDYATDLLLSIDSSTYVLTAQLLNKDGDPLGDAQTIDLPLESMVVGGSYNSTTKKVILTLKNGQTVEFSIADLVNGLVADNYDHITLGNGKSLYISDTAPTGDIPDGSVGVGW